MGVIRRKNDGFTLIEALIAASIGAVVLLALVTGHMSLLKEIERIRVRGGIDSLATSVRFNSQSTTSLLKSLQLNSTGGNHALRNCICGTSPCAASTDYNFTLYDATGAPLANGAAPIRYDSYGALCSGSACAIESSVKLQCIGSNCGSSVTAAYDPLIRVSYSVRVPASASKHLTVLKPIESPPIDVAVSGIKPLASAAGACPNLCPSGGTLNPATNKCEIAMTLTISGSASPGGAMPTISGSSTSLSFDTGGTLTLSCTGCSVSVSGSTGPVYGMSGGSTTISSGNNMWPNPTSITVTGASVSGGLSPGGYYWPNTFSGSNNCIVGTNTGGGSMGSLCFNPCPAGFVYTAGTPGVCSKNPGP